jgi:hypothetical protein
MTGPNSGAWVVLVGQGWKHDAPAEINELRDQILVWRQEEGKSVDESLVCVRDRRAEVV